MKALGKTNKQFAVRDSFDKPSGHSWICGDQPPDFSDDRRGTIDNL
jgi:hypothetical protein